MSAYQLGFRLLMQQKFQAQESARLLPWLSPLRLRVTVCIWKFSRVTTYLYLHKRSSYEAEIKTKLELIEHIPRVPWQYHR